jgi:NADH:ubiquinone oxidoreductase subunit C
VDEGFGSVTVEVPVEQWAPSVRTARDGLGCDFFDFLTAVDDPTGLRVVCHLVSLEPFDHVLLRTVLPQSDPVIASVGSLFDGAGWHERETAEMFGITFLDPSGERLDLPPLLLPPGYQGHPLRKEHQLGARLERPWPGDKGPGGRP